MNKPSRHEHEKGAPLIEDCDHWCKYKFKQWQEQQTLNDNAAEPRENLDSFALTMCLELAGKTVVGYERDEKINIVDAQVYRICQALTQTNTELQEARKEIKRLRKAQYPGLSKMTHDEHCECWACNPII